MTLFKIKNKHIKEQFEVNDEFEKFMSDNNFPERDQTARIAAYFMFENGLTTPVISIYKQEDAAPRAYKTFPTIFTDQHNSSIMKNDEFLIEVPDGYNNEGKELKPTMPHEIIPEDEAKDILDRIHGGGWGPMCDVYWTSRQGTSLPNNFIMNDTVAKRTSYKPSHAFLLDKSNTSIIWDFIQSASGRTKAVNKYIKAIKKHVKANNIGYYINSSQTIGSDLMNLSISVCENGSGELHPDPNFKGLIAQQAGKAKYGNYIIDPDTSTKSGKELQKLFNLIPPLGDKNLSKLYFETISPTQIIVTAPPSMDKLSPKLTSLSPMSLAAYHWLKSDNDDQSMGITLPTMPTEIRNELSDLRILNDTVLEPIKLERLNLS